MEHSTQTETTHNLQLTQQEADIVGQFLLHVLDGNHFTGMERSMRTLLEDLANHLNGVN